MTRILRQTTIVVILAAPLLITDACTVGPALRPPAETPRVAATPHPSNDFRRASGVSLVLRPRKTDSESVVLHWSTGEISSALNARPPQAGYWHPGKVILVCLSSKSPFSDVDFTLPTLHIGYYGDGSILKTVTLGTEGKMCVFDIERDNLEAFEAFPFFLIKYEKGIRFGLAPLPVNPPLVLGSLDPGFYAIRIAAQDNLGRSSDWVGFQVKN